MITEEKTKKNPAYQAINQTNAPEVKAALDRLHSLKSSLALYQDMLTKQCPDICETIHTLTESIGEQTSKIKTLIQEHGSYQDAEAGEYALIYERKTPQYDAQAFKYHYMQFSPAVIVDTVNADALKGLIKGGLIALEDLESGDEYAPPVITYKTSHITVIQ